VKCAIMQPTYLPWAGYFNLIEQVDAFVFLDDVQFRRGSWQARNRVLLQGREHMLTVPTRRMGLDTRICQARISERSDWWRVHWRTLEAAYGKAAHGAEVLAILASHYTTEASPLLSELNQAIIEGICRALGITTRFVRATDLGCAGDRSIHLVNICESLKCDQYLSPAGSREYLEQDGFTGLTTVGLAFQEFTPVPYTQYRTTGFVSHLSIVDVLANKGVGFTKDYIG